MMGYCRNTFARRGLREVLACAVLLLACGCRSGRPREEAAAPVSVPEAWAEAVPAAEAAQPAPDKWWTAFEDERLDGLVAQALADNLSLKTAWARLDAARALARIEGSRLWPQVDLGVAAGHSHTASPAGEGTVRSDTRSATPAAAYEVDLWGRLRSLRSAAELDAQASRADLDAAAMTLAANVAGLYFQILEQRAQLGVINRQLKTNNTFLDLVNLRFQQGQAVAVDVYQQRQLVARSRAQLPLVHAQLRLREHQLAVLLGQSPGTDVAGDAAELPGVPGLPATGVPSGLLKRRPDMRAAELRIIASDHRLAAAIADRFPSVRLTASLPFQAAKSAEVFKYFVWSLAGGASVPLVDGGRRVAEADRNRAVLRQNLNGYADTILTALREVEDALVQERRQAEYLTRVEEEVSIARDTLRESRSRYVNGLTDFLPVLTALRDVQRLELTIVAQRRLRLGYRVDLYRALGGSWMKNLTPPAEAEESEQ